MVGCQTPSRIAFLPLLTFSPEQPGYHLGQVSHAPLFEPQCLCVVGCPVFVVSLGRVDAQVGPDKGAPFLETLLVLLVGRREQVRLYKFFRLP